MKGKKFKLLFTDIVPNRYGIIIHPNFEDYSFHGEETISLTLRRATKKIVLHSRGLKLSDVVYTEEGGKKPTPKASEISYDMANETVTIVFANQLEKGDGALSLKFSGALSDDMRGFYKSRYKVGGEDRFLATTQFESTDARRAFPCIDEPEAKAVFDVTMIVPKHHQVISNTVPIDIGEHESGYKVVKFAPTPKMSTYLLAFISGEFESVEGKNKDGVLVRVFTTPGKKKSAEFALEVAKRSLEFYTKYFDIPYPMAVLDMIATPDFAAGAMENWGAVTYRESAILVDPDHTSAEAKQWVALVVAHELAHQWFGNLVTMKWWTDLWLNEGFASYIEYLAVDKIFPEWKIWDQFVSRELGTALRLDALENTHPIEVPVGHPNEISEIFDAVSYSKGATVIRMLAEYLGEQNFRDGLRHYLKKYSYGNAETRDLWQSFEEVSGQPVSKMMSVWTQKAGYPLVSVDVSKKGLTLSQSRFYSSPLSGKKGGSETLWKIPISVSVGDGSVKKIVLGKKKDIFPPVSSLGFVKINSGETGMIRARYSEFALHSLREKIGLGRLPVIDRMGVIRDVFALAESGDSRTVEALSLASCFADETEYVVWLELASALGKLRSLYSDSKYFEEYKSFCRKIFTPIVDRIGWTKKRNESHSTALLRDMVIFGLGISGDVSTVSRAKRLCAEFFESGRKIDKDLKSAVYFLAASSGDKKMFNDFIDRYKHAELPDEKERLGEALGFFPDSAILSEALNFSLSADVRSQDAMSILRVVAGNRVGTEIAWNFVKKNWRKYLALYGEGGHILPRVIQPFGIFHDKSFADDIEKFFKVNGRGGIDRTIKQVAEKIRSNHLWIRRDGKDVGEWLSSKN